MVRELVIDSLRRPRLAARRVLELDLPPDVLLQAAVVVGCAATLLFHIASLVVPAPAAAEFGAFVRQPLLATLLNIAQLYALAALAAWIGQRFGGGGTFRGATAIVILYNAVSLLMLSALVLALLLVPPFGMVLAFAFSFWMIWAPANFVAELHGFRSALVVFAGVVVTAIGLLFAMGVALRLLGLAPPEMG